MKNVTNIKNNHMYEHWNLERVGGRFASGREGEWDDLYLGERGRGVNGERKDLV